MYDAKDILNLIYCTSPLYEWHGTPQSTTLLFQGLDNLATKTKENVPPDWSTLKTQRYFWHLNNTIKNPNNRE